MKAQALVIREPIHVVVIAPEGTACLQGMPRLPEVHLQGESRHTGHAQHLQRQSEIFCGTDVQDAKPP